MVGGRAAPPPPGFNNARPCSAYYGQLTAKLQADYKTPLPKFHGKYQPYAVCGYVPVQYRIAYGAAATPLTGKGVTVGIIDAYAAPTIVPDANTYSTRHGDSPFAAGQFTQTAPKKFTNQKLCGPSGWYGEETLDVEAVHSMAPGANVVYVGGADCSTGLDTAWASTIDDHVADVMGEEQIWIQDGWAARFGLDPDPQNTGYGHTPAQIATVRPESAQALIDYYAAVHARTRGYLQSLTDKDLDRIVDERWDPPVTLGVRLVSVVNDDDQHVGQAAYLRSLLPR